jgi:uncharacterized circularly permuted ATP-grasp superfamily protein
MAAKIKTALDSLPKEMTDQDWRLIVGLLQVRVKELEFRVKDLETRQASNKETREAAAPAEKGK